VDDPVIKISVDQVCCELNGEAVILSLNAGKYYGLGEVGARIWALIQEPRKLSEIHRILLSEFEVESERCERDLRVLIANLNEAGLVEIGS
jgi:hypothetical protein